MANKKRDKIDVNERKNSNGKEHPVKEPLQKQSDDGLRIDIMLPPGEPKK
jgi:hypothetical protein